MHAFWLTCLVGLGFNIVLIPIITSARQVNSQPHTLRLVDQVSSLLKRDEYIFVPGISNHQHSVLTKAFSDAIFLALNAVRPPSSLPLMSRVQMFSRYFPYGSEDIVDGVYLSIVGSKVHSGNQAFSHLLVDTNDHNHVCETTGLKNWVNRNGTIVTVCPAFWTYIGDLPERTCADLPDDVVSWQMTFPGHAILIMLLGFVSETGLTEEKLEDYTLHNIETRVAYSGPQNAIEINQLAPDKAAYSIPNYAWYALVSTTMPGLIGFSH